MTYSIRLMTKRSWIVPAALLATLVAVFWPVLARWGHIVPVASDTDFHMIFAFSRALGFAELAAGNLALWNPYVYGGVPYLGGMQSALLYPPNWVFLILPLAAATTVSIIGHLALSAVFMYRWARYWRFSRPAAFVAAVAYTYGAPQFLHLYAGHLPHLCAMPWVPLLMLALDGLIDRPSRRWVMVGSAALAMQILAGFPQYVFYTGVLAALYVLLRIVVLYWPKRSGAPPRSQLSRSLVTITGTSLLGVLMTTVQLWPGLETAELSVRSGSVSYDFCRQFSFPPENLVTFLAPDAVGTAGAGAAQGRGNYWGRAYPWEMSVYVGVVTVMLAAWGAWAFRRTPVRIWVVLALVSIVLALGGYTPLLRLLHAFVPGFDKFRSNSKFILLAACFVCMTAAAGLDRLARQPHVAAPQQPRKRRVPALSGAVLVVVLLATAGAVGRSGDAADGWWARLMQGRLSAAVQARDITRPSADYTDAEFIRGAAHTTAWSLTGSAIVVAAATALLGLTALRRVRCLGLCVLSAVELVVFARGHLATAPPPDLEAAAALRAFFADDDQYRVLAMRVPNQAVAWRAANLDGYEAIVLRRYAEFIAVTQGIDPDQASMYLQIRRLHPWMQLLGLRYVVQTRAMQPPRPGYEQVLEVDGRHVYRLAGPDVQPRVRLVRRWRLAADRDAAFAAMNVGDFNPRDTVVLERSPEHPPVPQDAVDADGTVRSERLSSDVFNIRAKLKAPALLVVAENFCPGWRVVPGDSPPQDEYEIIPAYHALQAVPLAAGRHDFVLEYAPPSYRIGRWITAGALLVWVVLAVRPWRWRERRRQAIATPGAAHG